MFDAKKISEEIISFIRNYFISNNIKGAVIGISGGKDSAVVAGLFSKAIGPENVVGLWMPCHSKEEDKNNAKLVGDTFGFKLIDIDLTDTYEEYINKYKNIYPEAIDDDYINSNINIKPRLRMATLYYNASLLTSIKKGLYIVPGTSNACELYVGYFTKGGDNVADIQVLANLNVEEVIKVGMEIGVPKQVVLKTPDDGLSGMSDEEKLGVTYDEIAKVIKNNDTFEIDENAKRKILKMHRNCQHKFNPATYGNKYE